MGLLKEPSVCSSHCMCEFLLIRIFYLATTDFSVRLIVVSKMELVMSLLKMQQGMVAYETTKNYETELACVLFLYPNNGSPNVQLMAAFITTLLRFACMIDDVRGDTARE